MDHFDDIWRELAAPVFRYIRFRVNQHQDAEDIFQEVMTAAALEHSSLTQAESAKAWVLGVARHKCADWLRRKYQLKELPLDASAQRIGIPARFAAGRDNPVLEALDQLAEKDQQILRMFYWHELPQGEIAHLLGVPPGTVKSRLHHARERFRAAYPCKPKGDHIMKHTMPLMMPAYTITPSPLPPFECKWEEMMGWFIVPKLGEKLTWAMYDDPDHVRTECNELTVTGRASVHGVEGVEIEVRTNAPMPFNAVDDSGYVQRSFIAQLTDTHCRTLAETHTENGVKQTFTFLDGDPFVKNWGFGKDNCGNETHLRAKGEIIRNGDTIMTNSQSHEPMDVVGRYTVTINGKTYDTICVIMHETYQGGMASEQFIDKHGRTVLWRRFNANDWHHDHYGRPWTEMLPDSEVLTINGKPYVHWYDCITSYIL